MKRTLRPILGLLLALTIAGNAAVFAAGQTDTAVAYLVSRGIYAGDDSGNLNLDMSLTRAELAVILTRLDYLDAPEGPDLWNDWGEAHFSDPEYRYNTFTDVPDWALPYVEYCYQRSLMKGISASLFGPQDKVSPKMACTVILRYCGVPETDWSYDTSVTKALTVGIAPGGGTGGEVITRGVMAEVIYRGVMYAMTVDDMKLELVRLVNAERAKAGLPALETLPELMDCAQLKADDMRINGYFSHESPVYGSPGDMIWAAVPKAWICGENLVGWPSTPDVALEMWMDSPGHRANILSDRFTHIGIGVAEENGGYIWVQQFVGI